VKIGRSPFVLALLGVAVAFGTVASASAQGAGEGFLFRQPVASITVRGGYAHATAGSDLFSFVTDTLTLDKGDFSGPTIGADLAIRVAPRFDVVISASYAGTSTPSHYRNFIDNDNNEITQTTEFRRVPLMLSGRAYLTPRGRAVGRFAWVPARFAPYVGVGGGAMWYQFKQHGDFVDFTDSSVFTSSLASSGWTPAAQGLAGLDFNLSPHVALNGEAKYIWAKGTLDDSYSGFDKIDLSGFSASIGLVYRY
jgi:outer membrane protein W